MWYECSWPTDDGGDTSAYLLYPGNAKWNKYNLTFHLETDFAEGAKAALLRAFRRWEAVTEFRFTEENVEKADLLIGMYKGRHQNCRTPFDGPSGKVLAHAYRPRKGQLHFNEERVWSFGGELHGAAVDFETVAVHELGHILGLDHSEVKDAVMYPRLYPSQIKRELHEDDIKGITCLYAN